MEERRCVFRTPCSVSTLFLMGFLREGDVQEGGHVSDTARLRAEARYADHMSSVLHRPPRLVRWTDDGRTDGAVRAPHPPVVILRRPSSWRTDRTDHVERSAATPPPATPPPAASQDAACSICLTRAKEYACVPCFHLCSCKECGARITSCPMCRAAIHRMQRIYV